MSQKDDSKTDKKKSNKSTIKEIIEIAIFLGLAILVVFSFNWILADSLNTDIPLVVVTSESMEPTYYGSNRSGHGDGNDIRKDMLIVRGVDPSEIKVGDTIVFYRHQLANESLIDYDREPIVHRVNNVYKDNATGEYWFTTKGDNYVTNGNFVIFDGVDELTIHESRLIGKIVGRIKYLGGIVNYFKTVTGKIVLVTIIAVIMLGTWLLSAFGDDEKEDDLFKDKKDDVEKAETKSTFWDKVKSFYRKVDRKKHIIYPSIILGIIVFIPIVDTLAADWDSHYGIQNVVYDGAQNYNLENGNHTFVFVDISIGCPGHWHQKFRSFSIVITNATTGEVLGENNWTIVYNFEGNITVSSGAWLDPADAIEGASYNMTVTANLRSKFGKTTYNVFTLPFNLIMR